MIENLSPSHETPPSNMLFVYDKYPDATVDDDTINPYRISKQQFIRVLTGVWDGHDAVCSRVDETQWPTVFVEDIWGLFSELLGNETEQLDALAAQFGTFLARARVLRIFYRRGKIEIRCDYMKRINRFLSVAHTQPNVILKDIDLRHMGDERINVNSVLVPLAATLRHLMLPQEFPGPNSDFLTCLRVLPNTTLKVHARNGVLLTLEQLFSGQVLSKLESLKVTPCISWSTGQRIHNTDCTDLKKRDLYISAITDTMNVLTSFCAVKLEHLTLTTCVVPFGSMFNSLRVCEALKSLTLAFGDVVIPLVMSRYLNVTDDGTPLSNKGPELAPLGNQFTETLCMLRHLNYLSICYVGYFGDADCELMERLGGLKNLETLDVTCGVNLDKVLRCTPRLISLCVTIAKGGEADIPTTAMVAIRTSLPKLRHLTLNREAAYMKLLETLCFPPEPSYGAALSISNTTTERPCTNLHYCERCVPTVYQRRLHVLETVTLTNHRRLSNEDRLPKKKYKRRMEILVRACPTRALNTECARWNNHWLAEQRRNIVRMRALVLGGRARTIHNVDSVCCLSFDWLCSSAPLWCVIAVCKVLN